MAPHWDFYEAVKINPPNWRKSQILSERGAWKSALCVCISQQRWVAPTRNYCLHCYYRDSWYSHNTRAQGRDLHLPCKDSWAFEWANLRESLMCLAKTQRRSNRSITSEGDRRSKHSAIARWSLPFAHINQGLFLKSQVTHQHFWFLKKNLIM